MQTLILSDASGTELIRTVSRDAILNLDDGEYDYNDTMAIVMGEYWTVDGTRIEVING